MIRITEIKISENKTVHLSFSDGTEKSIDFALFIKDDQLSRPLLDPAYFRQVKVYDNGRGIYWPNGYDFCPDFLRHHMPDLQEMGVEEN